MAKVKICGITNLEDAIHSVECGADALGFNFYVKSPRYISPATAGDISRKIMTNVMKVGVFVNSEIDAIVRVANESELDAVQLHGEESPQFVDELRAVWGEHIVKAFRVSPQFDVYEPLDYSAHGILLDGFSSTARGGTGEAFDWGIAKDVQTMVGELWLAGGLTPENVVRAVAEVEPFAVDACSSLESVPGKKDPAKVEAFIRAARSVS